MKAYLITTGSVFALIALLHIARMFAEPGLLKREPEFIALTLFAGGLSVWGWCLLRKISKR